jgi:hypothetical protein
MKIRISLFITALFGGLAVIAGPGASVAQACGSYWNIPVGNACQYYTPSEAHAETTFSLLTETSRATHELSHLQHYLTRANGSWIGSDTVAYGVSYYWYQQSFNDKVGCRNHHSVTVYVNCHHHEGHSP